VQVAHKNATAVPFHGVLMK